MAAVMADGLESEYVQLEAKPFAARWNVLRLSDMVVQFGYEGVALVRRIRVPVDRWAFMIPLRVPGSARWNGCSIHGNEIIVCAPGSEGYGFDPGGTIVAVVSFAAARLPLPAEVLNGIVGCAESMVVRPGYSLACALRDSLLGLAGAVAAGKVGSDDVSVARGLKPRLAACLRPSARSSVHAVNGRSAIVRRAESFYRSHVGEAVSIAQLSAVAGVSERSLRNAFYHVYSTSPKRYLKLWQLHQVRNVLKAHQQSVVTVTDVATDHGFYELGRFATEYRALFGERPSQTLQKARSRFTSQTASVA